MKKLLLTLSLFGASLAFAGNAEPAKSADAPKKDAKEASDKTSAKKPETKTEAEECCAPDDAAEKPAGK